MLNQTQIREALSQRANDCDADVSNAEIAGAGYSPTGKGASISISVERCLNNRDTAEKFLRNLTALLETNFLVCLQLKDFSGHEDPTEGWRRFCTLIADRLKEKNLTERRIATCIHSHRMPLPAYCLIADSLLGRGTRYVFLDRLQMSAHRDERVAMRTSANWLFMWQQRNAGRQVVPVYGGLVRSACKLLADEKAMTIEPTTSLLIPAGTAWIHYELRITRFSSHDGKLDWKRLRHSLRSIVVVADRLIDQSTWRISDQQQDARANRRLAIRISGLGDLLQRRQQQPNRLASLEWLKALVRDIKGELTQSSASLAVTRGAMPALLDSNPADQWRAGEQRDQWQRYWRKALNQAALRNRNLLVLSPESVLPCNGINSAAFVDLLPLLALADAWSFSCSVPTPEWTLAQFKDFHCRARATIQASQRASLVAGRI